jgi:hypothetical protein
MTSENASNSRSSGRGRYRSTTPRKLGNSSPQPSPGDVLATDLPLSESAVASSSPRKRRVKSPPPETTPTRLRQTIPMTAGAHESILGRRTRKTVTSSPSPASSFINLNGPQDTAGGRCLKCARRVDHEPGADTQEGGSSTESSVLSKQRATPSIQGDGNRLDAAAFNAPSREASVPPVVNAAYGGAPSYYGSMQPHPGVAHNMPYRYGAPYGYYSMHVPGGPWPNHHVDPLFSTSPIPSMLNLAPDNIPAATSTATATYRSTSQSLDVPRSSTLVDARPLPTEPIPSMSNLAPDNTPAATSAATATYRSTLQSLDVPRGSTLVDAWPLPTEPMSTEQASIDIGLRLPPPQGLRNSEGVKMAGNSPPR